ncbi:hypothetical protein [Ideonella sp. A 288]|uniref:hypothetical protein n=1 Tax=Ideonella sp. A 288 TaxID=1962181 RepID=UPI000B4BEA61|nr:hypothetical protein [Ideonella sp. A 288]
MTRLPLELHRLYAPTDPTLETGEPGLVDAGGQVRAMVLELRRPADWAALARVWQGVQADLDLPAPAIAVSGQDGYQLWFSVAQPVPAARAIDFLDALRARYLGDVKASRVALWPRLDADTPTQVVHAPWVPAPQADNGRWSAFVAADLAPVFADEPWLDLPPNPDGQASLLAPLASIAPADWQRVLDQLRPAAPAPAPSAALPEATAPASTSRAPAAGGGLDPKRFLLEVMNDETVALALRVEAAKALLPYADGLGRP